jgi:hypothetical protein
MRDMPPAAVEQPFEADFPPCRQTGRRRFTRSRIAITSRRMPGTVRFDGRPHHHRDATGGDQLTTRGASAKSAWPARATTSTARLSAYGRRTTATASRRVSSVPR